MSEETSPYTQTEGNLAFELHRLTAELDRAADRILQQGLELSYRRFLTLVVVAELAEPTQRALARELGITEPSTSRMIAALAGAGYLHAGRAAQGGNRRHLKLTAAGRRAVREGSKLLEGRARVLTEASGVDYENYSRHTRALLATLQQPPG